MSEVVAAVSWRAALVPGERCRFERDSVEVSPKWWCNVKQLRVMKVEAQMVNPSTCSSRISIDIPLHEIPGVNTPTHSSLSLSVMGLIWCLNLEIGRLHLISIWKISQGFLKPSVQISLGATKSMRKSGESR